jgi:hypothetical protein
VTAAVDRLDYELVDLLDQDDALGHSTWCDRSACSVVRESDGSLFGFHETRTVADVELNGWEPGEVVVTLAQQSTADKPSIHLQLATETLWTLLPIAVEDVAPLVAALTLGRRWPDEPRRPVRRPAGSRTAVRRHARQRHHDCDSPRLGRRCRVANAPGARQLLAGGAPSPSPSA